MEALQTQVQRLQRAFSQYKKGEFLDLGWAQAKPQAGSAPWFGVGWAWAVTMFRVAPGTGVGLRIGVGQSSTAPCPVT